jgi:hypothetical protein
MGEIQSNGYQDFRDYVVANWDYIEIYDDTGTSVTRLSISGDSRSQWLDLDGDKIIKAEFDVTGVDSDISLPVTLESSALWDASSGGDQKTLKEQFASAHLNQDGDSVKITHTVSVPQ